MASTEPPRCNNSMMDAGRELEIIFPRGQISAWIYFTVFLGTLLWRICLWPLLDVMLDYFCLWSPSAWRFLKHCSSISTSSCPNLCHKLRTHSFCLWCCALPAPFLLLCIFLLTLALYSESASVWHSQTPFLAVSQSRCSLQKDYLKGATVHKLVVGRVV